LTEASDPDQQQLDRLIDLVREVLEPEIVGAYLFGSAVVGGLKPDSDLDLFLVVKRPTTRQEKQRLASGLMAISGKIAPEGMWRRLELTVVVQSELQPWRYPPALDFQYGDWLRGDFEQGRLEPWPTALQPDLVMLAAMVLGASQPVFGPPAAAVIDPPPPGDLQRAMVSDIDRIREDLAADTRNVILTLARMWSTFATGKFRSKDSAADWALERLPAAHRPVLARARDFYLGRDSEHWEDLKEAIAPCVDYMVAEIKRLGAAGG